MLHLHVNVFPRTTTLDEGGRYTLRGVEVLVYINREVPAESTFGITFEEAAEALQELVNLDFEPDGYFVWAGTDAERRRWQVEGHLFDYFNRLRRVELNGHLPEERLDDLLGCFGWPRVPLVFELVREGALVTEEDFRRWAAAGESDE